MQWLTFLGHNEKVKGKAEITLVTEPQTVVDVSAVKGLEEVLSFKFDPISNTLSIAGNVEELTLSITYLKERA